MLFKFYRKVTKYLGYFCKKICHQGLSKKFQSGLTDLEAVVILLFAEIGRKPLLFVDLNHAILSRQCISNYSR